MLCTLYIAQPSRWIVKTPKSFIKSYSRHDKTCRLVFKWCKNHKEKDMEWWSRIFPGSIRHGLHLEGRAGRSRCRVVVSLRLYERMLLVYGIGSSSPKTSWRLTHFHHGNWLRCLQFRSRCLDDVSWRWCGDCLRRHFGIVWRSPETATLWVFLRMCKGSRWCWISWGESLRDRFATRFYDFVWRLRKK